MKCFKMNHAISNCNSPSDGGIHPNYAKFLKSVLGFCALEISYFMVFGNYRNCVYYLEELGIAFHILKLSHSKFYDNERTQDLQDQFLPVISFSFFFSILKCSLVQTL
uniref:Uncharacterized protein n=1 Tax=Onchocerca volvulus TaxID=6282 RepID=A0A8R1Y3R4_ONCVO